MNKKFWMFVVLMAAALFMSACGDFGISSEGSNADAPTNTPTLGATEIPLPTFAFVKTASDNIPVLSLPSPQGESKYTLEDGVFVQVFGVILNENSQYLEIRDNRGAKGFVFLNPAIMQTGNLNTVMTSAYQPTATPAPTLEATEIPLPTFAFVKTASDNIPVLSLPSPQGESKYTLEDGVFVQVFGVILNENSQYLEIRDNRGAKGFVFLNPAIMQTGNLNTVMTSAYQPTATPAPTALPTQAAQSGQRLDTCVEGSHFNSGNPHPLSGTIFQAYGENSKREPTMDMKVNDCGWYFQPGLQPFRPLAAIAVEFIPGTYSVFGGKFYLDSACEGLGTNGVLMSDHQHGSTFVVEIPEGATNPRACGLVLYDLPGSANGGSFQFQWRQAPIRYNGVVELFDSPNGNSVNTLTASLHVYAVEISEDNQWVLLQQGLNEYQPEIYGGSIWGWAKLAPMVADRGENFNDQGIIFLDDFDFRGLPRSCDIEGRNIDCQVNSGLPQ